MNLKNSNEKQIIKQTTLDCFREIKSFEPWVVMNNHVNNTSLD